MRIRVSGEYGFILMSLAAIGIFYGLMSWLIESVLLMNVPDEEKDDHILSKLLLWFTLFLLVADVLLVILPVFGIELLPFTLLDLIKLL
jgi:hypothetical protein